MTLLATGCGSAATQPDDPSGIYEYRARGYIPPELWDPGINAGLSIIISAEIVYRIELGVTAIILFKPTEWVKYWCVAFTRQYPWSYNSSDSSSGSKNKWQHIIPGLSET